MWLLEALSKLLCSNIARYEVALHLQWLAGEGRSSAEGEVKVVSESFYLLSGVFGTFVMPSRSGIGC